MKNGKGRIFSVLLLLLVSVGCVSQAADYERYLQADRLVKVLQDKHIPDKSYWSKLVPHSDGRAKMVVHVYKDNSHDYQLTLYYLQDMPVVGSATDFYIDISQNKVVRLTGSHYKVQGLRAYPDRLPDFVNELAIDLK